jgi:hypothetical protein
LYDILKNKARPHSKKSNGKTAENIPIVDLMKNPEMCAPITPSQLFK